MGRKSKASSDEWAKAGELAEQANAEGDNEGEDKGEDKNAEDAEPAKTADSAEDAAPENAAHREGPSAEELSEHISKSGNKTFEEETARQGIGEIKGKGTGAYIEIVVPRQPALEAALRAAATESAMADGSLKAEDAPGNFIPEGATSANDGGKAENGNSLTDATKGSDSPDVNPNSPIQIGDTPVAAAAGAKASDAAESDEEKKPVADTQVSSGPQSVGDLF